MSPKMSNKFSEKDDLSINLRMGEITLKKCADP
jgi:hypothetical protein